MHELSIAQSLIRAVLRQMQEREIAKVRRIAIRVGPWSGVFPDALQFSYEMMRSETPLASTDLVIEESDISATCKSCGRQISSRILISECPECQSDQFAVSGGDELEILYLELE